MSHPTIAERARAKQAAWENTFEEAAELYADNRDWDARDHAIRDLIASALWLVDHTFATGECGVTLAREGDIQDLTAAAEKLRKVAGR